MFRPQTWIFCLALILLAAAPAHAAEGHSLEWGNLAWRILNIALVAGVIWKLAGAAIRNFFRGRRTGIEKELHDLDARKEEARRNLQDVEKRIANLETERQAILADYRARGEALAREIIAKAEARAKAVSEQAEQASRNEIDQALAAMRAELAAAIALATREALEGKLTPERHEELIEAFLDKVVLQ